MSMISGTVVPGIERDVVVGIKGVAVSLMLAFFFTVGAAVVAVFIGAQVGEPRCLVELLLGV